MTDSPTPDAGAILSAAGLEEAHDALITLLSLGYADDVIDGPRWRSIDGGVLRAKALVHLAESALPGAFDHSTGALHAAHAAARALMVLQRALEQAGAPAGSE